MERNGFPDPELYEAFNAKIKLENYLELDPGNPQHRRIIDANWSDVSDRLYHGGQAQCTIGQSALAERIPDEKDREDIYKGLWYPLGIWYYKPSTEWPERPISIGDGGRVVPYRAEYDDGPRNINWVEENLQNPPLFANKIMGVYSNSDHEWYDRILFFPYNIPDSDFPASIDAGSKYSDITRKDKEVDLSRFIHSLVTAMYDEDNADISQILSKSVGCVLFEQRAPYRHGIPDPRYCGGNVCTHGEAAVPIPINILDEIRNHPEIYGTPIIGPGQSIGWVPNLESAGKEGDDIPYVYFIGPDVADYIQLDEEYDMDNAQRSPDWVMTIRKIE